MTLRYLAFAFLALSAFQGASADSCSDDLENARTVIKSKITSDYLFEEALLPNMENAFKELFAVTQADTSNVMSLIGKVTTFLATGETVANNPPGTPCGSAYVAKFLKGNKNEDNYNAECSFQANQFADGFDAACLEANGTVRTGGMELKIGAGFDLTTILKNSGLIPANFEAALPMFGNIVAMKTGDTLKMNGLVRYCKPRTCTTRTDLENQLVEGVEKALEGLGLFGGADIVSQIVSDIPGSITMNSCAAQNQESGGYEISIKDLGTAMASGQATLKGLLKDKTCEVCTKIKDCTEKGGSAGNALTPSSSVAAPVIAALSMAVALQHFH